MKSSRCATVPERLLIVYVPELAALLREAGSVPPLIRVLVSKSPARRLDETSLPLAELLVDRPIAAAALTRRIDFPEDHSGIWLRADPIGLVPDLAAVWLQPDHEFSPGDWVDPLIELFRDEGLHWELSASGRGYLRLDTVPDCRFRPPWQLAGESLEHLLPQGGAARRWLRLLTESQVLLQQCRQRADDSEPIPGSLWFWGAGHLPPVDEVRPRVSRLVSDDPAAQGLADWLALERLPEESLEMPQPGTLHQWSGDLTESADSNLQRLLQFLRPAWRQLRTGRIRGLELADRESVRRYRPLDAWRVWR